MPLSIGIVGLPNVGKSTLFQALTKKQVDRANYPFTTINPNIGVVSVSDERLDKLAELIKATEKIYTIIEFVDIAGLVKGANRGEGLGNQFLANIRETNAIVYILRSFLNEKIINTLSSVNPIQEKEILDTELIMKDLEAIEKRIEGLEKEEKSGSKEAKKELEVLNKARGFLQKGLVLAEQPFEEEEKKILNFYQLLSLKPRLYLLNSQENEVPQNILEIFKKNNWHFLVMDALTELEAADFTRAERKELNLPAESQLENLIKKSYQLLNLITFFTIVSNKPRAWTIKNGEKVIEAAGLIHNDFKEHFIKADVINWKELVGAGGFSQAREKGLIRTEGKEYIVQDGDVIEVKHNA